MDVVKQGKRHTPTDEEKKRLLKEVMTQRDILNTIAQHMGIDAVGKLAGLCRASNEFVNLTRADIGGFISKFGDAEMRRRYTDRLVHDDLLLYNEDRDDYDSEYNNVIEWKYDSADIPDHAANACDIMPLHVALQGKFPEALVLNLIRCDQQALQLRDIYGNFPLHLAITNGFSREVVRKTLQGFTNAAEYSNVDNLMPLHLCIKHGCDLSLIIEIFKAFPGALQYRIKCGCALHLAIKQHPMSFTTVMFLLDKFPGETQVSISDKCYPLHMILVKIHGTSEQNENAMHLVCKMIKYYKCDINSNHQEYYRGAIVCAICFQEYEVIAYILRAYPSCASLMIRNRVIFPIHLALERCKSFEIIRAIDMACPAATQAIITFRGISYNAIDIAISHRADIRVLDYIVTQNPSCLHHVSPVMIGKEIYQLTPAQHAAARGYIEAERLLTRADR